jgi:hypothetical protein
MTLSLSGTYPWTGNHPSQRPKVRNSKIPRKKDGIDTPTRANVEAP